MRRRLKENRQSARIFYDKTESAEDIFCIVTNSTPFFIPRKRVCNLLRETASMEGKRRGLVSVDFVGAKSMRSLNEQWRGLDRPTDIISLQYVSLAKEQLMGEIIVCPFIVRNQARKLHIRFEDELAHVIVHGTLHVCGQNHDGEGKRAEKFREKEDGALKRSGFTAAHKDR